MYVYHVGLISSSNFKYLIVLPHLFTYVVWHTMPYLSTPIRLAILNNINCTHNIYLSLNMAEPDVYIVYVLYMQTDVFALAQVY